MKKSLFLFIIGFVCSTADAILTPLVDSIPMPDGRKLAADIYIPAGMSSGPVILIQTPYNRQISRIAGLPMGIGQNLNSANYIFVITDWRGFYGSAKAAYIGSPDRTADGYATVEWIAAQTWSNKKVGTWGPSALGKIQFQTAKRNPPHLVCICPSVAAPQFEFNEYYPNGALRTEFVEQLDQLGFGLTTFLMGHPYKDNTWNFVEDANDYADSIKVPCFMIGGWYDHNTQLMMNHFEQLRLKSFFTVRSKHKLLMGPWVHGGHGSARVGTDLQGELTYPNAKDKNDSMSLQFFDFYMRGISNNWESNFPYIYYQMGQNEWKQSTLWPPAGIVPVRFYLTGNGILRNTPPGSSKDTISYLYDPTDPSPTIGGPTLRNDLSQGPFDQKNVESRNDQVSFTTAVLKQDVVLKGNVTLNLKVSSDRLDTDFDVRLTDVYPDGRSMLVNDAVMRMRFRDGFTQAQTAMMVPGKVYDCKITLPATCITFLSGHRIRLVISSSNYPRFNRNMNNGGNMYPGNSTDSLSNPLTALNTIHMDTVNTSYADLPLLDYTASVSEPMPEQSAFSIYPNPVGNKLFVQIQNLISEVNEMMVMNQTGQVLMRINGSEMGEFVNISSLQSGIYFVRIDTSEGSFIQKFVKL